VVGKGHRAERIGFACAAAVEEFLPVSSKVLAAIYAEALGFFL
jgi:hypothetical protein